MASQRWLPIAALLVFVAAVANGHGAGPTPPQATAFMGTWVIDMTGPAAFNATHVIRIWDMNGVVAASSWRERRVEHFGS